MTTKNKRHPLAHVFDEGETLESRILDLARNEGATHPQIADTGADTIVILDADSGITWRVELRQF